MKRYFAIFLALILLSTESVQSDGGRAHRRNQTRPIKLGTSGGNVDDQTTEFCCSGTLGALVEDASGKRYILSNNHVLALNNRGDVGDQIIQPGLIDRNCRVLAADAVATLSDFVRIRRRNRVDAAIAEVIPGKVNRRGRILDIGRPGTPTEPALGLPVKKSGRTTGRTVGFISALNVTVRVEIPDDCGSENVRRVRFIDQFVVTSSTSREFVKGGDSGSLIVQRTRRCPASVGLLFAGDEEGSAVANRITSVLNALDVRMVGCPSPAIAQPAQYMADPAVRAAAAVQTRYEEQLLKVPGIAGVGIGKGKTGATIVIYIEKGSKASAKGTSLIPATLDGLQVQRVYTSGFRAL